MAEESRIETPAPDPAAVFACAFSLWEACNDHAAQDPSLNLSDSYNGMDQLMREVMHVANEFESWACPHVDFERLNDVWPYMLEDKFGEACLAVLVPTALAEFDNRDCLRVALRLRLPVKVNEDLPVPIDVTAYNPVSNSSFREFRIQTVRELLESSEIRPFTVNDEPFDEEFEVPYFALYGVGTDGLLEHIADRRTYLECVSLAQKLAPGIALPSAPTS
jgi:hypothetical protein